METLLVSRRGEGEVAVRRMNRELRRGCHFCWPAESADGDIIGTKSFSQMVLETIFRSKERGKQTRAIR